MTETIPYHMGPNMMIAQRQKVAADLIQSSNDLADTISVSVTASEIDGLLDEIQSHVDRLRWLNFTPERTQP